MNCIIIWTLCAVRYYRKGDKQKIAEAFHAHLIDDGIPSPPWDYNVAPTTLQPIIRNNRDTGERELVSLRWGLIPFFTKDPKEQAATLLPPPKVHRDNRRHIRRLSIHQIRLIPPLPHRI